MRLSGQPARLRKNGRAGPGRKKYSGPGRAEKIFAGPGSKKCSGGGQQNFLRTGPGWAAKKYSGPGGNAKFLRADRKWRLYRSPHKKKFFFGGGGDRKMQILTTMIHALDMG